MIIGNQGFSLLNFRRPLIEDLCAEGHEVIALASEMPEELRFRVQQVGASAREINLARTGINPFADIRAVIEIYNILRELRPDLTLSYSAKPVIYGTVAAWLARVPHRFAMIEGLGYVFIDRAKHGLAKVVLRRIVKWMYRLALARANKVFFLNQDDISDFVQMNLIDRNKALLLGGIGVDLNEWSPAPPVSRPVTFTLVARLLRDKGVIEFVEAARVIKTQNPDTRFFLVGGLDSNPESISASDVQDWVSEGVIEWAGHTEVAPYLKISSVFVLPSYREGLPRSTQEAMAMARAVITTDAPGCRETVIDGLNGFLVPVQDAAALAKAMQRFIDNPHLIVEMGTQSRRLAEERFDVHDANRRVIEALDL